ncbi:MAG: hypothetical protein HON90_15835 [Halobacteriovoraceae bacterium]|jgi:hypothetical protein|nr:hypothetical protein [Halobacteriovoraceae bacterium]
MKHLIFFFCVVTPLLGWAQILGRVIEVKGNAFSFKDQKTSTLKYGSKIYDLDEIMVEDESMLSIVNSAGHVYHVNGGSFVKFYKGIVEVKNGYVWIQSNTSKKAFVNTTNSIAQFGEGQFIYSFDNISGKTQLLVLEGDVKFSNALEPKLFTKVHAGYFSLVDQKYENGLPRAPTKVGLGSYKKMKGVFAQFKILQDTKLEQQIWGVKKNVVKTSRSIASVAPAIKVSSKKGRLIVIKTYGVSRVPASTGPMNYYLDLKKKEAWKYKPIINNDIATIHYFGQNPPSVNKSAPKAKTKEQRKPASRVPASIQKSQMINELKTSKFEASLKQAQSQNQRHSTEVNGLIDDLKTYKQDFKKKY